LAHALKTLEVYKHHYMIVKKQKAAHEQLERNFQPGQLLIDIDFAENFTIIDGREIQSQYWVSRQVTLFIGITQHLCSAAWADKTSSIEQGTGVTVDCDGGGVFWAEVISAYRTGDAMVHIQDSTGRRADVERARLHKRKIISTAHITVSDDKHHDTHFVQKAVPLIKEWCDKRRLIFTEHLIRSDGAGSHFKNRFTLQFLTLYQGTMEQARVSWCFGAPGHGKGPWDGLAGTLKHSLRRRIIDRELLLKSAGDVHRELAAMYGTEEWRKDPKRKKGKISEFNIQFLSENDITRPTADSVDVSKIAGHSRGIRGLFSFWVVAKHRLASRVFSCWCAACCKGERNADNQTVGCERGGRWEVQDVTHQSGRGQVAQHKEIRLRAEELCSKVTVGDFVAMETADYIQAPGASNATNFYICRVMEWEDGTLVRRHSSARGTVGGKYNAQHVKKGDPLLRVCYYTLDSTEGTGLVFVDSASACTVSGCGFRHILQAGTFGPKQDLEQQKAQQAQQQAQQRGLQNQEPHARARPQRQAGIAALRMLQSATRTRGGSNAAVIAPSVPVWAQRELSLSEKQQIEKSIAGDFGA
jgi:hypothetical protein